MSVLKLDCLIDFPDIPIQNLTKHITLPLLIQALELPLGIICCCIPSLKPAIKESWLAYDVIKNKLAMLLELNSDPNKRQPLKYENQATRPQAEIIGLQNVLNNNHLIEFGPREHVHEGDLELTRMDLNGSASEDIVHSYPLQN
jgi:hypothetical protein